MTNLVKYALHCLLLIILTYSVSLQAALQAKVDRQYAYEGETVTLSISTENRTNLPDPDFSPLAKDFEIGGTSESTQISIFNGKRSDRHTWSVRLMPKRTGKIEIPSIQLGQQSTLPLQIDIRPVPVKAGESQGEAIFLTLEIDSDSQTFYVQQQIPLVARLYYKHELSQGQISDPKADNVILERLGEDQTYTSTRDGQNYRVFERRYSLLAEKSGDLQIPPVSFQGYIAQQQPKQTFNRRNDPFAQFFAPHTALSKGQPISLRSKPLSVMIEPHPTAFNGKYWLPAESLELKDSWTDNPPQFQVGEPVTRVITLSAKGLLASQIQPLELPQVSSFRRYAEPPEVETRTDGTSLYATSRRTFTYIPQFAGEQEIPSLQLAWWNVISGQQETAKLTAWNITVKPDPNAKLAQPAPLASSPAVKPAPPAPQTLTADPAPASPTSRPALSMDFTNWLKQLQPSQWQLILAVIIVSLLLLIALRYLARLGRQPRHTSAAASAEVYHCDPQPDAAELSESQGLRDAQQAFRTACAAHQAEDAARALLMMSLRTWDSNPPMSLGALAEKLPQAAELIMQLDRYLYSDQQQPWQGDAICELLGHGLTKAAKVTDTKETLKPLYPESP